MRPPAEALDDRAFVLPPDAPLVKNLAALWAADPALAEALESLHPLEPYPVEPTKAGPPTVVVTPPGGADSRGAAPRAGILLHSRYQPLAEAERLLKDVDVESCFAFYVHGFGLGYHVEQLFERAGKESLVLVFEPDVRLLWTALHHRDFSKLIASRRVLFFTRPDKSELFVRLTPHAALIYAGATTVNHPPSLQAAPEFHEQFQTWLSEFASFSRTSMNTLVLNSRRTAENIARNIARYVASPGVGPLRDRHKGVPAVVVSAGPSLRKNKHLLKQLQGRAVIIAVQTTLKPLLELGVEPDYVTSLDYHDICTRFFENLPPGLKTELVAEPKAASAVLGLYPGRVTLLGNEFADSLLRDLQPRIERARLPSGATVAHLAFYLAEQMGSDPIIFVGQDLGFSDGLCYAPGTSYDDVWRPELSRFCTVEMKQWEQIARERFILRKIPDYQGRPMYTEERLFTYLQQFERDFARSKAKIIDATEGGAAKRGAEVMPLSEAVEKYAARHSLSPVLRGEGRGEGPPSNPQSEEPLTPTLSPEYRGEGEMLPALTACLQRREEEARQIEDICRATLPLLEEIRDHVHDQPRVNRCISAIDALRAKMNELGATYDLVTQLTQSTELQRFKADRQISASKALDGNERQRRQVARDIDNVRAVADAARDFQHLMRDTIDLLHSRSSRFSGKDSSNTEQLREAA
jgi:hypothetical protein